MSNLESRIWHMLARLLPKKLLYFAVIHVWARATTEKYTNKTPDEVSWTMAVKFLEVE